MDLPFGIELRRLRVAAGLSLSDLSGLVHYTPGQLSKVETGVRHPTVELARLCDSALRAQGTLACLAPAGRRRGNRGRSAADNGQAPPGSTEIPAIHEKLDSRTAAAALGGGVI